MNRPNILFLMADQQRYDTIAALGNPIVYTPNYDRLVRRGITFTKAYSTCPVCTPARYTIRTGCEPHTTTIYQNSGPDPVPSQAAHMEERCGPYLARALTEIGYRTFGVGKFHAIPRDEDLGYEIRMRGEEMFETDQLRATDSYAQFIARQHPGFNFLEDFRGNRTEGYYVPQSSPVPLEITQESWVTDRTIEFLQSDDARPFFAFASFVGPHPPIAPPIPYNRMYNPDDMPNPIRSDISIDHMDEQIPWMNYGVWADDVSDSLARSLKARYYGQLTFIDQCFGRILDALEKRGDADNTIICCFSDHGDHLGDHHAWQKESFFEASAHVPLLVSWPKEYPAKVQRDELVCLTDLFGFATSAAGKRDLRQGCDLFRIIKHRAKAREHLIGYYGTPGTGRFKIMVREKDWKYIYFANGGGEQLFNVTEDPQELHQRITDRPDIANTLREVATKAANRPNVDRALENGKLRALPFQARPLERIRQFDRSRGIKDFPKHPSDLIS